MAKLLNLIGIVASAFVLYTALMNSETVLHLSFLNKNFPLNFALFTLVILGVGIFTGAFWVGQFYMVQKEKLNAYKRELEKSSISSMTGESKIEVLEAKIATLEKALDDALNK